VPRNTNTFTVDPWMGGERLGAVDQWRDGFPENGEGQLMGDFRAIYEVCAAVANCYYIGPLRTALGTAGGSDYDSEVGGTLISRWRQLKLVGSKRNRQRAAAVTERIRALFALRQFDIDVGEDNNRLIAAVDGETYGYTNSDQG
jgi:hypothetical protein